MDDEMKHKAQEGRGGAERKHGEAADDPGSKAKGHFDQGASKGKQAGARSGETMQHLKEGIRNKARQFLARNK